MRCTYQDIMVYSGWRQAAKAHNRGATLVEFALIAGLMLMLVIVGMQMLLFCYMTVALQFVAARSMRASVPHQPQNAQTTFDKALAIESLVLENSQTFLVPVEAEDVHVCLLSAQAVPFLSSPAQGPASITGTTGRNTIRTGSSLRMAYQCPIDSAGSPGSFFSIYIYQSYRIPLIGLDIPFQALAVGQNEL